MASKEESRIPEKDLQSDATPINPKYEEVKKEMKSLTFKTGNDYREHSKDEYYHKEKFQPPPNFNFFKGFPFANGMGQNISAAGNVNAIQIGYANNLQIGNVINIKDCTFNKGKPKSSHSSSKKKEKESKKSKVKVPNEILTSTVKVTRDMMLIVKDGHLGYKWKPLGIALDIPDGILASVEYENRGYDLDEIVYQMLRRWEQKFGDDCTVGKLAQALEDIEAGDVALKLV